MKENDITIMKNWKKVSLVNLNGETRYVEFNVAMILKGRINDMKKTAFLPRKLSNSAFYYASFAK